MNYVKNAGVLHRVKEERTSYIIYNLALQPHSKILEGKIEGSRRQGRRCKQLMDDVTESRRNWNLEEEALVHTL
jgi:hypothetical protein